MGKPWFPFCYLKGVVANLSDSAKGEGGRFERHRLILKGQGYFR
jgi:hypothetical protein